MERADATGSMYDYLLDRYGVAMSPRDVAEVLRQHPAHVRAMCQRGDVPAVRVGERWHIPTAKLACLLDGGAWRG